MYLTRSTCQSYLISSVLLLILVSGEWRHHDDDAN